MRKIVLLLSMIVVVVICHAHEVIPKGNFEAKKGVIDGGYNFWMYTPHDYEIDNHKHPVLIFLHGASLCGRDLNRVRRYGVLDAIDKGKIIPALVIAPQNPGGAWNPKKINDLLEWVKKNYRVDDSRVYVLGMSLGGYGTLDFVGTYPEKVAAAMALCGGCSLRNQEGLGKVPLWVMHGTADKAVNIKESKAVVDRLQQMKQTNLLRYDWLKGGNHGLPARLFYLQKTYDWLFFHSLKDKPRTVDTSFDITKEDIASTYQELREFRELNKY